MSHPEAKELEKGVEKHKEEEIRLLEDRRAGKLIFFVSWYFLWGKWLWNVFLPAACVCSASCAWLTYYCLRDIYSNSETSDLFPTLWLTIHYSLAFVIYFVDYVEEKKNLTMEAKTLQKLLEEVSKLTWWAIQ